MIDKPPFIIDNRFLADPSTNILKDLENETESRLEPRLMHLLCLLSDNKGKVLGREYLVKEIWNDYGGGDEGLSQAISFLRKVLADDKKQIIETIPKKGYMLYATISGMGNTISEIITKKNKTDAAKNYHWLIAGIVVAILFAGYVLFFRRGHKNDGGIPDSQRIFLQKDKVQPADTKRHDDSIINVQKKIIHLHDPDATQPSVKKK